MGESIISNTIDNYNSSIEKEEELAKIINGAELEEGKVAKEVISNIDAAKLADLIEKNFKSNGVWKKYGDMKKDSFYNFYVEATIDLLSDKLLDSEGKEKKFSFNWKEWTLDDHLKDLNWIDNNYSRELVRLAQNAMWIKESQQDGLAWPQFFAKACSILSWNWISEFRVNWFEWNNKYKYDLDDDIARYNKSIDDYNEKISSIISSGWLNKFSESINRAYYWIPDSVEIYTRNNFNWYYYFSNHKIIFVPDLNNLVSYPICLQEADISNSNTFPSSSSWAKTYPTDCAVFKDKINSILSKSLSQLWITADKYSLEFDTTSWKYVLNSYWKNIPIALSTLTDWWIYSNDIWNNLKLLNLCNYLKSTKRISWFSFSNNWKKLLFWGREMTDVFAFNGDDNCYKKLDESQQTAFLGYLNNHLS